MTPFATMLLAAVVIGNSCGQLMFKLAAIRAAPGDGIAYWRHLLTQPVLWSALLLYVVEFLLWLAFLSSVPLWLGVMVACIDIPVVMVLGRVVFGEGITPPRLLAISLIAVGVLLVGWDAA